MALYEEASLEGKKITLEQKDSLSYIKLGFIGPQTLDKVGNLPNEALSLFRGFFIASNHEEMRATLHKLVDQACDAHEQARRENG